jgi:hypothetical protein
MNQNSIQEEIKNRLTGIFTIIWCKILCLLSLLSKNLNMKIYRTIILPVFLYGFETRSLTLRGKHRLRVLRRIFGPKRDKVTGEWRKLHNEEFNDLYFSPNEMRPCSTLGR